MSDTLQVGQRVRIVNSLFHAGRVGTIEHVHEAIRVRFDRDDYATLKPFQLAPLVPDAASSDSRVVSPSAGARLSEAEADAILAQFQRACERVVVEGDSNLSATTKERAILRNAIRVALVGQPSTDTTEEG